MSEIVSTFNEKSNNRNRTSRYRTLKRLLNKDDEEYIETYETVSIKESPTDSFYIVEREFEHRLDLVSYKYYNNPLLYWIIAEASGISDPFHVPIGTVLRIPEKTSLFGTGGVVV